MSIFSASRPDDAGAGAQARHGTPGVTIRAVGEEDLEAIVAIERASFADPWSPRAFAGLLGEPHVHFRAACDADGAVVGYVAAWFVAGEGEVANIAVAPSARGRGIGAALLDAVIAAGRDAGAESLYLDVRESNAAARSLYASRGFAVVGRRRGYYRLPEEDALVLRCRLARRDVESHAR
jgi:ribosomal-protein-alanine N-acetyltransferase